MTPDLIVESVKLHLRIFEGGWLLETGVVNPEGEAYETARARAAIEGTITALQLAGYAIVPCVPTEEMVEAGAAADWVGEVESRAGLSILPDSALAWDAQQEDYVDVRRPGIWYAMLDAGIKHFRAVCGFAQIGEVTHGKATG